MKKIHAKETYPNADRPNPPNSITEKTTDNNLLLVKIKGIGNITDETLRKIRKGIKKQMEEGLIVYPEQVLEIKRVCNCENVKVEKGGK